MALATMEEFEQFGQVDITNQSDVAVLQYIDDASEIINSYCDRTFEEDSYVQTFDVDYWSTLLRIDNWPLTAVASIVENDLTLVEDEDFVWTDDGLLRRISASSPKVGRNWLRGVQVTTVTYTGGYAAVDVPKAIRAVCLRSSFRAFQAAATFANAGGVAVAGVSEVDLGPAGSITYQDADSMPALADVASAAIALVGSEKQILDHYRRRT